MKCSSKQFFRCVFSVVILLGLGIVAKAQDTQETRRDIFDPFDRWFGNISSEMEQARLDNFTIALQENPDWIGYIVVYAGKKSCEGESQRRANRMKRYVVEYRGIPWNRVMAKDGGYFEDAMVILQPIPRDKLSNPLFAYMPATEQHVVRKCAVKNPHRTRRAHRKRAAKQRHAPDPRHGGSHVPQRSWRAGDAGR
jgi:hypothetical protein